MPIDGSNTFNTIVSGIKSLNSEAYSLAPSAPVFLYEIDFSEIYPQTIYITTDNQPVNKGVMRIYNDVNIFDYVNNSRGRIYWQGNYYYPFPIMTDGFETNAAGTLPNPKFSIANASPDGSENSFYKFARMQVQSLGDLAGCKFTRIKTFLKYLHPTNFLNSINPYNPDGTIFEVEFPKDIFYIDRKSLENKQTVEYSLASILDIENVSLPGRTILATKCPFQYRGEGCLYEYEKRKTYAHSGVLAGCTNLSHTLVTLPLEAPPTSTDNDELFLGKIFTGDRVNSIADSYIFSGIDFTRVGDTTSNSTWTFSNFNLANGSSLTAQTRLSDNNYTITGANTTAAICSITVALNNPAEITKLMLNSATNYVNNFNVDFSIDAGSTWEPVKTFSGNSVDWILNGKTAGSYVTGWPTVGSHKFWRIRTTNSVAGTNLTELALSGQYRIADSGLWGLNNLYRRGEFVYLEKLGIKYYYVSLTGHSSNPFNAPPNRIFWATDNCSKSISACRDRWTVNPYFRPVLWPLGRGGWSKWKFTQHNAYYGFSPNLQGDLGSYPRRPGVFDPFNKYALGLPKDYTGQYLNGFLPFGGFPGVNRKQ